MLRDRLTQAVVTGEGRRQRLASEHAAGCARQPRAAGSARLCAGPLSRHGARVGRGAGARRSRQRSIGHRHPSPGRTHHDRHRHGDVDRGCCSGRRPDSARRSDDADADAGIVVDGLVAGREIHLLRRAARRVPCAGQHVVGRQRPVRHRRGSRGCPARQRRRPEVAARHVAVGQRRPRRRPDSAGAVAHRLAAGLDDCRCRASRRARWRRSRNGALHRARSPAGTVPVSDSRVCRPAGRWRRRCLETGTPPTC